MERGIFFVKSTFFLNNNFWLTDRCHVHGSPPPTLCLPTRAREYNTLQLRTNKLSFPREQSNKTRGALSGFTIPPGSLAKRTVSSLSAPRCYILMPLSAISSSEARRVETKVNWREERSESLQGVERKRRAPKICGNGRICKFWLGCCFFLMLRRGGECGCRVGLRVPSILMAFRGSFLSLSSPVIWCSVHQPLLVSICIIC